MLGECYMYIILLLNIDTYLGTYLLISLICLLLLLF